MKFLRDGIAPKGRVEIFTTKGSPTLRLGPRARPAHLHELEDKGQLVKLYKSCEIDFSSCDILDHQDKMNIVVDNGKDKVIEALTTGFINQVARMAIGDRGTIPSDSTVPKVPTSDMTELYNEVYRGDMDAVVLDVGTTPGVHEVQFIRTFAALTIPSTAFSNQAKPVVNEVGLIVADLFGGAPLPRADVAAPNPPDADESLFSIRTFKSVPFEAALETEVTIRYTIFIE